MLKNKRILLTILMVVLLLLIPNIVKADEDNTIKSFIVNIPNCILGEKPKDLSVSVKANGKDSLEITDITWEFAEEENEIGFGAGIMDENDTFKSNTNYSIKIEFKRPKDQEVIENVPFSLIGQHRGNTITSSYNKEIREDDTFYYDLITFNLGKAKAKINFNSEEVDVLDSEYGPVTLAIPGRTIKVLSMIDAESWDITVKGNSENIQTTEHEVEGELPYFEFIMPAENVEITATYKGIKQKPEIKTIDITVPNPVVGENQYGIKDIIVKANGKENLEVVGVYWLKGENVLDTFVPSNKSDTNGLEKYLTIKKFEKSSIYSIGIEYEVPNEFEYSKDLIVKVNGNKIDVSNIDEFNHGSSGTEEGAWTYVEFDFGMPIIKYNIIEGENQTFNIGKDKSIIIKIDANFNEFEAVYMDGKLVDKKNYEAKSGSTIITFNEDYLKTLEAREHIVKIAFKDNGEATAKLTIKNENVEEKATSVDTTKAPGTIPHAGGTFIMIASAALLIVGGVYAYRKNNDLKGI